MACTLVLAQFNPTVCDIVGNYEHILRQAHEYAVQHQADAIIFPELALIGYPAEDLLLLPETLQRCDTALAQLAEQLPAGVTVIVGYPALDSGQRKNRAIVLRDGQCIAHYDKQCLPNYDVFDEQRYFTPGSESCVIDIAGIQFGLSICEDLWQPEVAAQAKQAGAQMLLSLNASPFELGKVQQRTRVLQARFDETGLPIASVNLVGGQDELVFDGASMVVDAQGARFAPSFCQGGFVVKATAVQLNTEFTAAHLPSDQAIYEACVMAIHDYVRKNGFSQVVVGVSGGIDSALVLAMAVDALGADALTAVCLPSDYTSKLSHQAADQLISNLGVKSLTYPIQAPFSALLDTLGLDHAASEGSLTAQNLQSRTRGALLMAVANQQHALVLNTSNKSELAMGYGTLYGDMIGAFAPLKDIYKTRVFALSRWRNQSGIVIPEAIIERPPSAELAPEQTDQDDLPAYDLLDQILHAHIEQQQSIAELTAQGFDPNLCESICQRVAQNEYKRYQAPPGPKLGPRAFGKSRRYALTTG